MKKAFEIDGPALYSKNGISMFSSYGNLSKKRRRWRFNEEWINGAFTPYQRKFLESKKYAIRPKPSHNPSVEVFVDETTMSETDWTILRMIFDGKIH